MKTTSDLGKLTQLLDLPCHRLGDVLSGPILFDFTVEGKRPFFLSTLLHGNETSGWEGFRSLVKDHLNSENTLPSCIILLGNIQAAKKRRRLLDEQPDFNRIWEGGASEYNQWADQVIDYALKRNPWFALDIHNNTGPNPHHAVLASIDKVTLAAARLFSNKAMFATQPHGVFTRRTATFCTSLTLEAGLPDDPNSTERARAYVDLLWQRQDVPDVDCCDLDLYQNNVRVIVENAASISNEEVPIFAPKLHRFNFKTIPAGTELARLVSDKARLLAIDEDLKDQTDGYLAYTGEQIQVCRDTIMSMYTDDPLIARQDCVCYFLEPLNL